jgi:hypothetical protein
MNDDTIFDPELGEIPVIFEDDTPEIKAKKQKIIDVKVAAATAGMEDPET